jgi:hypothetical protein
VGDYVGQTFIHSKNITDYSEYSRNFKGYSFEMFCKTVDGDIPNTSYIGNPTNFSDWLQHHNENSFDATITYPNGTSEKLEMKYVSDGVKIESSWFNRDWLSRDADIIITNNPSAVKYKDRRKAKSMGKKIMTPSEFLVYASKKAYRMLHPNQLLSWNALTYTVLDNIQVITSSISDKIETFDWKSRLKKNLLELKSSVKAKLAKCHFASRIQLSVE